MGPDSRSVPITATGNVTTKPGELLSFSVTAAAATALLVLTDGNGGAELGRVSAVANTSQERQFRGAVRVTTSVYATLTGAGALGDAEVS